jgi:hypothetical protein
MANPPTGWAAETVNGNRKLTGKCWICFPVNRPLSLAVLARCYGRDTNVNCNRHEDVLSSTKFTWLEVQGAMDLFGRIDVSE